MPGQETPASHCPAVSRLLRNRVEFWQQRPDDCQGKPIFGRHGYAAIGSSCSLFLTIMRNKDVVSKTLPAWNVVSITNFISKPFVVSGDGREQPFHLFWVYQSLYLIFTVVTGYPSIGVDCIHLVDTIWPGKPVVYDDRASIDQGCRLIFAERRDFALFGFC